ncbi:hypothetical protein ACA758_01285 [Mycoplasmopsis agassizii]|uniref:Uncharacterized protein n=1 Tax=Mycoplasmopsis agassizii TaxID=33922 RepID=A0A1W1WXK0_9BACT|nr:hypothetical protein [Mycoplasmopsis agassizii]PAF54626.1 hypothetical protein CJF60_02710 [Mycoplasmopsis agassizii]PAK21070.1 hypothetical protein CJJ23_04040 [Mycoplasmopsis agassizii]SMC16323.1 hypothetical protein SAMN02745179_00260 [Mycoplasmopsis agassizii]
MSNKRIKKFEETRHSFWQEENLRLSLIRSDKDLKQIYDGSKAYIKNFEIELLKENKFVINYSENKQYEDDSLDLKEIEKIQNASEKVLVDLITNNYSSAFQEGFFEYKYFNSIISWDQRPLRSKIQKLNLKNKEEEK